MHPDYCQITTLLVFDLCSLLAYFMITHPLLIADKLPIKTLVARQLPISMYVCMYDIVGMFIGHYLATKGFIGKLPATTGVWVIIV